MFNNHEIIESSQYSEELADIREKLGLDARRMDDVLEGVMWGLGSNPSQFFQITRTLWLIKTDRFPGAPPLRIWFSWAGLRPILLLSIELRDESNGST
jgi:hypothetical protein